MPSLAQTRQLDIHGTIIFEHIIALAEESREAADTNVLAHLNLGDLVELALRDIAVIHAQKLALALGDAGAAKTIVTPGGLVSGKSNTGNVGTVVDTGKTSESTPTAADVEHGLAFLQSKLLADNGHLVILHLLEGLLAGEIREDTTGVNHTGAEEVRVVVIAAVVVGADLLLVLLARVEEHIRGELEEDEVEQGPGEGKVAPIVAVLHGLKTVTVEVDIAVEVHLVEGLHGDLVVASVSQAVLVLLESNVVLDGPARELHIVVDTGREPRAHGPVGNKEWDGKDEDEEDGRLEAAADAAGEEGRHAQQQRPEGVVGEGLIAGALCGQRRVVDGGELRPDVSFGDIVVKLDQLTPSTQNGTVHTLVVSTPQCSLVANLAGG